MTRTETPGATVVSFAFPSGHLAGVEYNTATASILPRANSKEFQLDDPQYESKPVFILVSVNVMLLVDDVFFKYDKYYAGTLQVIVNILTICWWDWAFFPVLH